MEEASFLVFFTFTFEIVIFLSTSLEMTSAFFVLLFCENRLESSFFFLLKKEIQSQTLVKHIKKCFILLVKVIKYCW